MTLNSKIQVELPATGVIVRRSGPYPAVYKVLSSFRNEKGQPTNKRVNIGKLDITTGKLIPNHHYYEYYGSNPDETWDLSANDSVRSVGASFLIDNIIKKLGIADILEGVLGDKRFLLARKAIHFMATRGSVFEEAPRYFEKYGLFEEALDSSLASEYFASITNKERKAFLKKWAAREQPLGKIIVYDVTSFSARDGDALSCELEIDPYDKRLCQLNIGCFISEKSGLPVYYVAYPGSIRDALSFLSLTAHNDELGIKNFGFVLGEGFSSERNLQILERRGYKYVLGVPKSYEAALGALDLSRDKIINTRSLIQDGLYGFALKGIFYGTPSSLNIYFSSDLAERQRNSLFRLIESKEKTLLRRKNISEREIKRYGRYFSIFTGQDGSPIFRRNNYKIDKAANNCGFFFLLSNTGLDPSEILSRYRRRESIENSFLDIINLGDVNKSLIALYPKSVVGKAFHVFLAFIVMSELSNKLSDFMKTKGWDRERVVSDLENIRVVTESNSRRLVRPFTETQRAILEAFELGEKDIKAYLDSQS